MDTPNYIEIIFNPVTIEQSGLLTAVLSHAGFEGFEEGENMLKAYIMESNFDKKVFHELMQQHPSDYYQQIIKSENWNAVWEQNFKPVIIDDFVAIRAHFHKSLNSKVQYELIVTPKMSFGTGHHATTYMMIKQMRQIDFTNKQVLDFGTGTGILAVLAEKLGAATITAIDIDDWSIKNAEENIRQNNCAAIHLQMSDSIIAGKKFDIALANINKNIILQNISHMSNCLNKGGYLLLSGLLLADESAILSNTASMNIRHINTMNKEQWISMLFTR